jgi:uracil-DNA glycosylase family 4
MRSKSGKRNEKPRNAHQIDERSPVGLKRLSMVLEEYGAAVKHFKWLPRGKRRLHQKPNGREITACRPWLIAELAAIQPRVLVCLGATAARALFGKITKISEHRGELLESELSSRIVVTVHPSSILRIEDSDSRQLAMRHFVADLRTARRAL